MITTFEFSYYLRTSKQNKNGESAIYLRLVDNLNNIYRRATTLYVKELFWDKKNEIVKRQAPKHHEINLALDRISMKLSEQIRAMEIRQFAFSKSEFESFLKGEQNETPYFLKFFEDRIAELKKLNFKDGTIASYHATLNRVKSCFNDLKWSKNLLVSEYNAKHIVSFEAYLIKTHKAKTNTLAKHHKNIKAVLSQAYMLDLIPSNPYKKYKVKWVQTERPCLTMDELKRIMKLSFSIERIETVKNLFLFSCFTGMSFSDLMDLNVGNIYRDESNTHYLKFNRNKTGNACIVPLVSEALEILLPFCAGKTTEERVFKVMSNQKFNSYLKEIADLAGITINLTHHVARHTFATTICNEGDIDIYAQKDMLGHSKITTTTIYSKNRKERLIGFKDKLQQRVSMR